MPVSCYVLYGQTGMGNLPPTTFPTCLPRGYMCSCKNEKKTLKKNFLLFPTVGPQKKEKTQLKSWPISPYIQFHCTYITCIGGVLNNQKKTLETVVSTIS